MSIKNYLFSAMNSARDLGLKLREHISIAEADYHSEAFSDGEVFVKYGNSIRGQRLFILAQTHMPYHNLFEVFLAVDAARRASVREIIVIVPYLPHSRQERKDADRTSIAARMVADFLQYAGADRLITFELHTNAIEGFYTIPVDHIRTTNLFCSHIRKKSYNNLCLVSPDFGGLKRVKKFKDRLGCDIAVINKERMKHNQISSMEIIGDIEGKEIVIIDDLIDTAGTVSKAADLLMDMGAKSVEAYATHGILSGNALEKIENSSMKMLYISDTIPFTRHSHKIEVITCAGVLSNAIKSIVDKGSIKLLNEMVDE